MARTSHGQRIDQPLAVERGGQEFFYNADHQGSVRKITDVAGLVVNSYGYDSYGRIEASTEAIANPFTYTAREIDAESGLYFYRARYYDAVTGRFLREDPIGFDAGDVNLYRYVFNNPVNLRDPSGLAPFLDCLKDCALDQLGIEDLLAGAAVADALFPKRKPRSGLGAPGGFRGTSRLSQGLSKLFPQKLGRSMPTPTLKNLATRTRVLGRLVGRATPIVGGGLLLLDAAQIGICTARCTGDQCPIS